MDPMTACVIECWNLMGAEIRWEAIGPLAEMLGVRDPELLIIGLTELRAHLHRSG
jgi:hypothetical protein